MCDPRDGSPPIPVILQARTRVGCHFLLQCIKVKSESEVAQSCPTLSDPMDCSLPDSSVHGIFQAGVLEWGAIAFSKESWSFFKNLGMGASLAVQWLRLLPSNLGCVGSIPGRETKISHAMWHSQKKNLDISWQQSQWFSNLSTKYSWAVTVLSSSHYWKFAP